MFGRQPATDVDELVLLDPYDSSSGSVAFSRLDPDSANDGWGWSLSDIGDLNQDGYDDIVISRGLSSSNDDIAFVIFGNEQAGDLTGLVDLSNTSTPTNNVSDIDATSLAYMAVEFDDAASNYTVNAAGDVDGDGTDDLLIGLAAVNTQGTSVSAYLAFGDQILASSGSLMIPSNASFQTITPGIGVSFVGNPNELDGYSVSAAGNVTSATFGDILIGAPDAEIGAGVTYLIYGSHLATKPDLIYLAQAFADPQVAAATDGIKIQGANAFDSSGFSVSHAGDIDGDGFNDILIGAPGANSDQGAAYLLFSNYLQNQTDSIDLGALGTDQQGLPNGLVIEGRIAAGEAGYNVSAAGDLDNDGIQEILIGAPTANNSAGEAYLLFGSYLATKPATISLDNLGVDANGRANGVIFLGGVDHGRSGASVSDAGDVNGDGYDDILIGGAAASRRGDVPPSKAYLISGLEIVEQAMVDAVGPTVINLSSDFDWI